MKRVAGALAILVPMLLSSAPVGADRSSKPIDVSQVPAKYQPSYKLVEVKCTKCHSLARAVGGRMTPDFWRAYIKKMSRLQGSGINERSGEIMLEFLIFYAQGGMEAADAGAPEPR